jgi:hypothetical protein
MADNSLSARAIALELGRGGVELRAIGMVNGLITGRPEDSCGTRAAPAWQDQGGNCR